MGNSLALGKLLDPSDSRRNVHVSIFRSGMHGKGILIPDVNASAGFRDLDTFSDVLAIYQEPVCLFRQLPLPLMPLFNRPSPQNLVYTGTRGGTVSRWDTRTRSHNKNLFLSNRCKATSITYLRTISRDRLFVGSMDGRLELFDLRHLLKSIPVTSFLGHVNSYSQKLVSQVSVLG